MTWPTRRLRHVVTLNPPVREIDMLPDGTEVAFLAMDSISDGGGYSVGELRAPTAVGSYSRFANDDVVFAKVTPCFENGKRARMNNLPHGVGFGTTELTVLRSRSSADPGFLAYLVHEEGFRQGAIASMTGAGGLKRVSDRYVKDFALPLPPLEEQRQIAAYLDRETGQIAELIAKQEQLLTALVERRRAGADRIIGGAFLEASAVQARRLYEVRDDRGDATPPLLSVSIHSGVRRRDEVTGDPHRADDLNHYKIAETGDVVLNRMRAFQGAVGVSSEQGLVSPDYLVLRPKKHVSGRWLAEVFRSTAFVAEISARLRGIGSLESGAVRTPRINTRDLGSIDLHVPSLAVQRATVEKIGELQHENDTLSSKAAQMIVLLRERRQALISAAVTGKIDVRSA